MMQALIRTALVGTANAPGDASTLASIDDLLPEGSREQRLLWQAGGLAVYGEAGYLPRTMAPPAAAPDETLPETPATLTAVIASAIAGDIPGLDEWLAPRVAQAGCRLPFALLPGVLDKSAALARWRHALGERGHWLAARNPDWRARLAQLTPQEPDQAALRSIWEEGDTAARAKALAALRGLDAASARELLAAALPKEKAEPRQRFVDALAANLSLDDEPLLESLLDDRAQVVRAAAANLLARLPDSALMRRMTARAQACVQWQAPARGAVVAKFAKLASFLNKPATLSIDVPNELPGDWARDGIVAMPQSGEGQRAAWLRQVLSRVAPARWSQTTGDAAQALILQMADNDWADALLCGCATAVCQAGDPAWSEAFLRFALERDRTPAQPSTRPSAQLPAQLTALIPALWKTTLPAVREDELCRQFARGHIDRAAAFARHLAAPWPTGVVRAFARAFFADGERRRTPEELAQGHDLAEFAQLAVLRAADADLALLAPVAGLYAGWLGGAFAGPPRMLARARDVVALMQARQTVIQEMPL